MDDPELGAILVRHAEELLAKLPSAGASWADRVRAGLLEAPRGGVAPSLERSAKQLGLSARTLQRRLGDEGTTFARVDDAVPVRRCYFADATHSPSPR